MPNKRLQLKRVDKEMAKITQQFRKNHLVMKKTKTAMGKMKSAGRYISALPPEPWITSFAAFVINALPTGGGSKLKKTLLKLISEQYSPEHWLEVEHLYEDIINDDTQTQRLMEGYEPPMDSEELGIVWEALMEEAERLDDEEVVSSNLNVRTLNEEVKKLQKKELSVKKQKRLRFYTFLKKFEEKLLTVGISGDAEIWRFLDIMISKVANISIKNRKEKEHGTQKKG